MFLVLLWLVGTNIDVFAAWSGPLAWLARQARASTLEAELQSATLVRALKACVEANRKTKSQPVRVHILFTKLYWQRESQALGLGAPFSATKQTKQTKD